LVYGSQFICQKRVQRFQNFFIAFHDCPPPQDL
jgi:hypothetical protein